MIREDFNTAPTLVSHRQNDVSLSSISTINPPIVFEKSASVKIAM